MQDIDVVALAKAEHQAILKQKATGKLTDPLGTVSITNQANVITVAVTGFVNFYQYEAINEAAEIAGDELKSVIVRINSMGGSAFAGVAIGNLLRGMDAKVTTINESAAMSAAAVIFMAGQERLMGDGGATLMFHQARGWLDVLEFGTRDVLEAVDTEATKAQAIEVLDALDEIILNVMVKGSKLTKAKAKALMYDKKTKDGKTLSNEEALELGLATGEAGAKEKDPDPEPTPMEDQEDSRAEDIELMAGALAILREQEVV